MYVLGGRGTEHEILNDLVIFDIETASWSNPILTEFSRCAHTMVPLPPSDKAGVKGSGLLVFGGWNGGYNVFEDAHSLMIGDDEGEDVKWDTRELIPETPPLRFAHTMSTTADGKYAYIFGGINFNDDFGDLYLLSFNERTDDASIGKVTDEDGVRIYLEEIF
jgi:hypothetical protein